MRMCVFLYVCVAPTVLSSESVWAVLPQKPAASAPARDPRMGTKVLITQAVLSSGLLRRLSGEPTWVSSVYGNFDEW